MKIKNVTMIFFSATEETKAVMKLVEKQLPIKANEIDITCYSKREEAADFSSDELVIFGVPVYGGRIPAPAAVTIQNMSGSQTPAVLIATYGNREYDDALLELEDMVDQSGFVTIAAAAFVTEHSIMHSVAEGRPDSADEQKIRDFSDGFWEKLQGIADISGCEKLFVKGNNPYREYGGVPLKPHSTKECTQCGVCAVNCPMDAIPTDNPGKTDDSRCISCMRCIKVCPLHARKLNHLMLSMAEKSFAKKCSVRKEPEIFI